MDFYYEDQYDIKSAPYHLTHFSIGYQKESMNISMWIRNLLDEKYVLRGYYFALEPTPDTPPHFFNKSYVSYGDPRHLGITISYQF